MTQSGETSSEQGADPKPVLLEFEDGFVAHGYKNLGDTVPLSQIPCANPYVKNSLVQVKTRLHDEPREVILGSELAADLTATRGRGDGKIRGVSLKGREPLTNPTIGEDWTIPGLGDVGKVENVIILVGRSKTNEYGLATHRTPFNVEEATAVPRMSGFGEAFDLLVELEKRVLGSVQQSSAASTHNGG